MDFLLKDLIRFENKSSYLRNDIKSKFKALKIKRLGIKKFQYRSHIRMSCKLILNK